jgi:hypothetical protein
MVDEAYQITTTHGPPSAGSTQPMESGLLTRVYYADRCTSSFQFIFAPEAS